MGRYELAAKFAAVCGCKDCKKVVLMALCEQVALEGAKDFLGGERCR